MRRFWLGLAAVLAIRLAFFWLIPLCAEDAYITFHAAKDDAWIRAATSPLWAILCSVGDPPTTARTLLLAADCAAVWAAWRILPALGFWAFCAFWSMPFFIGSACGGIETHAVAALLLVARAFPWGYTLAAALRPDAAVLALCASGRKWRWALGGSVAMLGLSLMASGHLLPQTLGSKMAVYGVHPGAWGWLHPAGFGWLTVPIALALITAPNPMYFRRPLMQVWAALAFLMVHVALGAPQFWWWSVPPLAMLGFAACDQVKTLPRLALALAILACFVMPQTERLHDRTHSEAAIWNAGKEFAALVPRGTVMLEPAGMIPYLCPQLSVIDDVGLVEPWMATRRGRPGWRTEALERFKPQWLIMRTREYAFPETWMIGAPGFYGKDDERPRDYGAVLFPGQKVGRGRFEFKMVSSNLIVLGRKSAR